MSQINLDNILDTIKKLNPWFKTGIVPAKLLKPYSRQEFSLLYKTMDNTNLATLLIGGRRVGKSILVYQLIDTLLKNGIDPKRILFILGDNPILRESADVNNILNSVIKAYEKYVLDEDISEADKSIYIFIDEAQSLPNWDAEVKTLIDLKYPIKFLITGSSSSKLRQGIQHPLVGRVHVMILSPFGFRDFIGHELAKDGKETDLKNIDDIRARFQNLLKNPDIKKIEEEVSKIEKATENIGLEDLFQDYLLNGGFPYAIENKESEDVTKYLRDILQMTFSKDVLQEDQIREPLAFERLMVNICMNISGVFKLKSLAERVGLKDERTVQRYIDYYVNSHYVFVSTPFSFTNKQENVRINKKIYVIDTGLVNTLLFKNQKDIKEPSYQSVLIENLVHNSLLRYKQCLTGSMYDNIPYWENSETHKEIDFVFEIHGQIYPIEVKDKSSINDEELIEIKTFLNKLKSDSKIGFVITKSVFEIRDNIILIPIKLFSLLL